MALYLRRGSGQNVLIFRHQTNLVTDFVGVFSHTLTPLKTAAAVKLCPFTFEYQVQTCIW